MKHHAVNVLAVSLNVAMSVFLFLPETSIVMQIADAMRESPEPSLKSPKSPKVSKKSANKKKSKPSNISDTEVINAYHRILLVPISKLFHCDRIS